MRQMLKNWWLARETLFYAEATVCVHSVKFCLSILGCSINLELDMLSVLRFIPLSRILCIFHRHFVWHKKLGNHKTIEAELFCDGALTTGFTFYKHIHCDHTPCRLEVALLGITGVIEHYDGRHWDDETDTYETGDDK